MPALGVVEALDVIEHACLGLVPRPVRLARRPFCFQRGEEALYRRIAPDVARPAHAMIPPRQALGLDAAFIEIRQDLIGTAAGAAE